MNRRRTNDHLGAGLLVGIMVAGVLALWAAWAFVGDPPQRPDETSTLGALADPELVYDPVRAGEDLPAGFRQVLDRDQIVPVYDPVYALPDQVDWPGSSLVIGVAGVEAAKAYPITYLNQHEMVIDSLEGIPILVTW